MQNGNAEIGVLLGLGAVCWAIARTFLIAGVLFIVGCQLTIGINPLDTVDNHQTSERRKN